MTISSVSELLEVLRGVPLLEPEQLAEVERLTSGNAFDARGLAGEMVRRGWLTPYQVNQLFQGRVRQLILGSFVLLERIGEGGMGQVFKARHRKLGRIDALKVIRKERLTSNDAVRRFQREIRAAAQLSHPNIVRALDADEDDGTHFFAMEYIEGVDLAKYVKQKGPLPVETACDFIRQAAEGIQHAHERGMVHRDIKPHNLLLVTETNAVKVLDMGLARLRSDANGELSSTSLTEQGVVMGTPDYIAPEQAMDSHSADIRADLYSLGCTFYFLLTGRVPFPGGTLMEKLIRHQTDLPRPPTEFRPDVPEAIVAVIHQLMAKRPADRYATPAEFLVALTAARKPGARAAAMSTGEVAAPVRPPLPRLPVERLERTPFADLRDDTVLVEEKRQTQNSIADRKRRTYIGVAVGAGILAVIVSAIVWKGKAKDSPRAEKTPNPGVSITDAAEKEWKALRTRGETEGVDRSKFRDELIGFRLAHPGTRWAMEAAEVQATMPSPLDRWNTSPLSLFQKVDNQPKELLAVLGDHRSWVGHSHATFVQWSSDGRWLACNAAEGIVRLLSPVDLSVKAVLKADEPLTGFDFRRDGKMLLTWGLTGAIGWDVSGEKPIRKVVLKDFPGRLGWGVLSPDGRLLALTCDSQPPTVRLWDISGQPKERAVLKGHTDYQNKPAFSPDSKTLATCSHDKTIRIWDLSHEQPRERAVLTNHAYWVVSVAFSPDGKMLASSGQHDNTVRLWDMTEKQPKELTGGSWLGEASNEVVFSPDGKHLASGFWSAHWRIWDVSERQLKQLASVPDHNEMTWSVSFSPDGRTLATSGRGGTIHLWNVGDMPPSQRFIAPGHGQIVTGLMFTPDDRSLISMSRDGTVRLWDMKEPPARERAALSVPLGFASGALDPQGRILVTGNDGERRTFWDIDTGKEVRSTPDGMRHAAYTPNGKMLIASELGGLIRFRDVETDEVKRVVGVPEGETIHALAVSPDGRRFAASSTSGIVHLWHIENVADHLTLKSPDGCASVLRFSPDGKILAVAGKDGRTRLFDAAKGRERGSWPGHEKEITFIAFSPDGKQLVTAGRDGRVVVRDLGGENSVRTLTVPMPIHAAALAADGRHLALGLLDGCIYIVRPNSAN